MKVFCLIAAVALTATYGYCEGLTSAQPSTNVVFREPFTLKLHVDEKHYYEQEFSRIPYVFKNDVYLFKGDFFGVDFQITNGVIRGVSYQSDTNKAAATFRFAQEIKDGDTMMLLVIENHTKHKLFIDALMTVPKQDRPRKTSILPIESGLSNYESWSHPIVQLVLRNIRLTEKPGTDEDNSANRRK